MIKQIRVIRAIGTDPYANLAVEACLLANCPDDCAILYLWQNQNTVVIGKNQNPWKECDLAKMEADGVRLARRRSGGGAVFHDLGNLNFTFVLPLSSYDVPRQMDIICDALRRFGIAAVCSGRNDILVDGCKVSGNAFQKSGGIGCHHGTLLLDCDVEKMGRYLSPSAEKLKSKGVDSVRSRVGNLKSFCPSLTVEILSAALTDAFCRAFSMVPLELTTSDLPQDDLCRIAGEFSDPQWLFGRKIAFTWENSARFSWGEIQLCFTVDSGEIRSIQLYSDAIETELLDRIPSLLTGLPFDFSILTKALSSYSDTPFSHTMISDICTLLTLQ